MTKFLIGFIAFCTSVVSLFANWEFTFPLTTHKESVPALFFHALRHAANTNPHRTDIFFTKSSEKGENGLRTMKIVFQAGGGTLECIAKEVLSQKMDKKEVVYEATLNGDEKVIDWQSHQSFQGSLDKILRLYKQTYADKDGIALKENQTIVSDHQSAIVIDTQGPYIRLRVKNFFDHLELPRVRCPRRIGFALLHPEVREKMFRLLEETRFIRPVLWTVIATIDRNDIILDFLFTEEHFATLDSQCARLSVRLNKEYGGLFSLREIQSSMDIVKNVSPLLSNSIRVNSELLAIFISKEFEDHWQAARVIDDGIWILESVTEVNPQDSERKQANGGITPNSGVAIERMRHPTSIYEITVRTHDNVLPIKRNTFRVGIHAGDLSEYSPHVVCMCWLDQELTAAKIAMDADLIQTINRFNAKINRIGSSISEYKDTEELRCLSVRLTDLLLEDMKAQIRGERSKTTLEGSLDRVCKTMKIDRGFVLEVLKQQDFFKKTRDKHGHLSFNQLVNAFTDLMVKISRRISKGSK